MLSSFLYMLWAKGLISRLCVWIFSFLSTIDCRALLFPLYIFGYFLKTQTVTIYACIKFWSLFSVSFIGQCFHFYVYIVLLLWLEQPSTVFWNQGVWSLPFFFFVLNIILIVWDLWWFHGNLRIISFISWKWQIELFGQNHSSQRTSLLYWVL